MTTQRSHGVIVALTVLAALLYVVGLPHNPPGFHIDESSIAYNAHTISTTGKDEHGNAWPLYFRAFGDYKNPTYIYALAGLYRLTGPSILVPRLLSALAGIFAALVLALLAARITRNATLGWMTALSALLTPWLFETSRIVLELAMYPLVLGLFLLCVHRVSAKERWSRLEVATLAFTLALATYTYSIGRLFGPLLALGLALFVTRTRWRSVVRTWFAYAITLVPLVIYNDTHPGALTERFRAVTYLHPEAGLSEMALSFLRHYFGNWNPWRLLVTGDPNRDQVTHIFGTEHVLAVTFVLGVMGVWVIARERLRDAWWRFVLYALAIAPLPASLTVDYSHMLRMIPVPLMLIVATIPAFAWLASSRPKCLLLVLALLLIQGAAFQVRFHFVPLTEWRAHLFDAQYRTRIFERAVAIGLRPIYIADLPVVPGYIQAYWYGTLAGVDLSKIVRLDADEPPPEGALVITTEENCLRCKILDGVNPYTLYIAEGPPRPRMPLPEEGFRAELTLLEEPPPLRARQYAVLRVRVKNISLASWTARERSWGKFHVSLGNRWLDRSGKTVVNDDGRAPLRRDLAPDEEAVFGLKINPPAKRGDYILELDMLQEGVSWFAPKGSRPLRLHVRVD